MKYLPAPEDYHKYLYFDTEADSLTPTVLWCMAVSWMNSDEIKLLVGQKEIEEFFHELEGKEVYFVGHNALSFDGPVTKRLVNGSADVSNVVDTLVLSYLYDPHLSGGHSLAAWGERLNEPKEDFSDFSHYSEEMGKYCKQDVRLGKKVTRALWQRMARFGFSELSCEIEHQIREVMDGQQSNGWFFDIPGAQALVSLIRSEQAELEGGIRALFPARLVIQGTYDRRSKKDGGEFASYIRHRATFPEIRDNEDGTYSTLDWRDFNIGSPKQRVERLLELGWEPDNFTEKGFPKVDEESLLAFAEVSGRPEAKAIAEWLVLEGRATMIEGWLNNVDYDDQCIHGRVFTCGASSRRMTHNSPNTANIPKAKVKVKYGIESRRCWLARPGRVLVGTDASGLELRMFAEYLNDPIATKLYTEGDPHMFNTKLLEEPDEYRDLAVKNVIYAMLYGAQDKKLGKTARTSITSDSEAIKHGKWVRSKLEAGIPGFKRLTGEVQDEFKHTGGLLRTIDGGFVKCFSQHAALNYKLQSAGAIVMKLACVLAVYEIRRLKLDALLVGNIHDELQFDCAREDAEAVGEICVKAIQDAGIKLGFKVPLTGKYTIGLNWAETH